MDNLDGKSVVVTGAGRGLGEAYALHVAQAGAQVVVNDIDVDCARRVTEHIRSCGWQAVASGHDVSDPEQAGALIEQCVTEFGKLDGLVNNAGLHYESLPWEDTPEQIRELVETNVLGVIYTGVAAIRAMRATGGGSIVNISSGAMLGQRKLATYAASKGAVASVSLSWALDCEPLGIRVNAVCPVAHTRMVWKSERTLRATPPDRTPGLVAPVVVYLLGDSSRGVTGQVVRCNGKQLHVVAQTYFKQPILEREAWDTASVQRAFEEVFRAHLEPFGLEKRLPPGLQELLEPSFSA